MSNENFTAGQWIKYFMDKISRRERFSVDEIREVVKTISVKDPIAAKEAVTIFYSGEGSSFPKNLSETAGGEIRMIDRTEACKFLAHEDFEEILDRAIKYENPKLDIKSQAFKDIHDSILYPGSEGSVAEGTWEASDGFWSIVSRRFASETSGDAYALVSNALPDRIFATDELKTLLETLPDGAKICGFDAAYLRKLPKGEAFRMIHDFVVEDLAGGEVFFNEAGYITGRTFAGSSAESFAGRGFVPGEYAFKLPGSRAAGVNVAEEVKASRMFFDGSGRVCGYDFANTKLEGAVEPPARGGYAYSMSGESYVETGSKLSSEQVRSALKDSSVFLDEAGGVISRGFEGTVLDGVAESAVPGEYAHCVSGEVYERMPSEAQMSAKYGEAFDSLSAAEKLQAREIDSIVRLGGEGPRMSSASDSVLRNRIRENYAFGTGKTTAQLNAVDEALVNTFSYAASEDAARIRQRASRIVSNIKSFASSPEGAKFLRSAGRIAGGALAAWCVISEGVEIYSRASDAWRRGRRVESASEVLGGLSALLLSFGGGEILSAALIAALGLSGVGAFFAGGLVFGLAGFAGMGWAEIFRLLGSQAESLFGSAEAAYDPIVVDLNGDGFVVNGLDSGAYFDENCDGVRERIEWPGSSDALLAFDKNGDGLVSDGSELFGSFTVLPDGSRAGSGFAALTAFDENRDGLIDSNDPVYSKTGLWIDRDGDGVCSAGEFVSLKDAFVRSVSLNAREDGSGRKVSDVGFADGRVVSAGEFSFKTCLFDAVDSALFEQSDDIAVLPDVPALGSVASLHSLIAKDESGILKSLVSEFAACESCQDRAVLAEKIMFFATGADSVKPGSRGSCFDAQKLHVIEQLSGRSFSGTSGANPVIKAVPALKSIYAKVFNAYYSLLNISAGFFSSLGLLEKCSVSGRMFDFSRFVKTVSERDAAGNDMSAAVSDMARFVHAFGSGKDLSVFVSALSFNEKLLKAAACVCEETIKIGSNGDDRLAAGDGDDIVFGGDGNDSLYGDNGNDVLIGGSGDDRLSGGSGDDSYVFNLGDGCDVVSEWGSSDVLNNDRIVFGEGISPESLLFRRVNNDLVIRYGSGDDQVTVHNAYYYSDGRCFVESIVFADGTKYEIDYENLCLKAAAVKQTGVAGAAETRPAACFDAAGFIASVEEYAAAKNLPWVSGSAGYRGKTAAGSGLSDSGQDYSVLSDSSGCGSAVYDSGSAVEAEINNFTDLIIQDMCELAAGSACASAAAAAPAAQSAPAQLWAC